MAVFRKRLIFWLIKAYVKKWGKIILISFVAGLIFFFGVIYFSSHFANILPAKKQRIGVIGAYTYKTLPDAILVKLSHGLTKVSENGDIRPDVASSWKILDSGKTYEFTLRNDVYFADGDKVTSEKINYEFADVKVERPNEKTIIFKLKDAYAPFLVTVARPIFKRETIGVGEYRLSDIELNGTFISTLSLNSNKDTRKNETYTFYPNNEAVKTAFLLGESTKILSVYDTNMLGSNLSSHVNVKISKQVNNTQLSTIFYNTQDSVLSDSKLRRALNYALPNSFTQGERTRLPYPKTSIYFNHEVENEHVQDFDHAKLLVDSALESSSQSAVPTLTLKVLSKYVAVSKQIQNEWKKIGVNIKIEEVDAVPAQFQMYLGDFTVPKDPDQYTLWHSNQQFNITKYRNLRIDKLLEVGRKMSDTKERKQTYIDFQKYLMDDAPASFLFFPYVYTVERK